MQRRACDLPPCPSSASIGTFPMADSTPSPTAPRPARKPWPMTWVAIAVVSFIVIHTTVNLVFRKPAPAHEPAAEARERQHRFVKAEKDGWSRYGTTLAVPPNPATAEQLAPITRTPAPANILQAISFDLAGRPERDPVLHTGPTTLETAAVLPADGVLRLRMSFDVSAKPVGFGFVLAYSKENHLHLFLQDENRTIPDEEPLPPAPVLELTLPPRVFSAGDWQASLYTKDVILTWSFTVPPEVAAPPDAAPAP